MEVVHQRYLELMSGGIIITPARDFDETIVISRHQDVDIIWPGPPYKSVKIPGDPEPEYEEWDF